MPLGGGGTGAGCGSGARRRRPSRRHGRPGSHRRRSSSWPATPAPPAHRRCRGREGLPPAGAHNRVHYGKEHKRQEHHRPRRHRRPPRGSGVVDPDKRGGHGVDERVRPGGDGGLTKAPSSQEPASERRWCCTGKQGSRCCVKEEGGSGRSGRRTLASTPGNRQPPRTTRVAASTIERCRQRRPSRARAVPAPRAQASRLPAPPRGCAVRRPWPRPPPRLPSLPPLCARAGARLTPASTPGEVQMDGHPQRDK